MSFLYFAYGSNMLTQRLGHRCPSARQVGQALAPDHTLEFTKPSLDLSGKATLVGTDGQGKGTPGVLFEIQRSDLPSLDEAEGDGYDRHDEFEVRLAGTDEPIVATTYLARRTNSDMKPYDWYLALVIAGALDHGLAAGHIERLKQTEYWLDDQATRPGRSEAIRALAAHGYAGPQQLLGKVRLDRGS